MILMHFKVYFIYEVKTIQKIIKEYHVTDHGVVHVDIEVAD